MGLCTRSGPTPPRGSRGQSSHKGRSRSAARSRRARGHSPVLPGAAYPKSPGPVVAAPCEERRFRHRLRLQTPIRTPRPAAQPLDPMSHSRPAALQHGPLYLTVGTCRLSGSALKYHTASIPGSPIILPKAWTTALAKTRPGRTRFWSTPRLGDSASPRANPVWPSNRDASVSSLPPPQLL